MDSPDSQPRLPEDIDYELHVLKAMLAQLPGRTGELILAQVAKVMGAIENKFKIVHAHLVTAVDDAILATKLQDFDLEATRRERDELRDG